MSFLSLSISYSPSSSPHLYQAGENAGWIFGRGQVRGGGFGAQSFMATNL